MGHPLFIVSRKRTDVFRALTRNPTVSGNFDLILDRRRRRERPRPRRERRIHSVAQELATLGFAIVDHPAPPVAPSPLPSGVLRALKIPTGTLSFLGALAPFKGFMPAQLSILAQRAREQSLKKGQVLFREGEPGGEMFVIRRGTVRITKAVAGKADILLRRIGRGEFFGEMSLLGGLPRTATASAETDTVVLGLDRNSLVHVIELSSRSALAFFTSVVQQVSRRLTTTEDAVAEVTRLGFDAAGLAGDRSTR